MFSTDVQILPLLMFGKNHFLCAPKILLVSIFCRSGWPIYMALISDNEREKFDEEFEKVLNPFISFIKKFPGHIFELSYSIAEGYQVQIDQLLLEHHLAEVNSTECK